MKVQYPGVSIVEWGKEDHDHDHYTDIDPFRRIAEKVKQKTDSNDKRDGKCIAHIHGALIKTGLRFKSHTALRAGRMHYVKLC